MRSDEVKKGHQRTAFEAVGKQQGGKISDEELLDIECNACQSII